MRIDVTKLEVGQVVHTAFWEVVASRAGDVTFDEPVTGQVDAGRTPRTAYVRGRLVTTAPMVCGRCLLSYRQSLAVIVDEEFLLDGSVASNQGELGPEDFIAPVGPDLTFDVTEIVRQQLLLTLPMVPVCRPDCRGLCAHCGTNLNERECGCQQDSIDPRFAPLFQRTDTTTG